MKLTLFSLSAVLFIALDCQAVPISLFSNTPGFVERAEDIVIAKCLGAVPTAQPLDDALYLVNVEIISVLKSAKKRENGEVQKLGKAKIATIYPMDAGKTYLLTSFGGSGLGTNFFATRPPPTCSKLTIALSPSIFTLL